nr:DUF736 family protein [Rhizobium sp. ERR1071]
MVPAGGRSRRSFATGAARAVMQARRRIGDSGARHGLASRLGYLSVKLDDPSFLAPVYARLAGVEGEDGLQLIWSRPNRD